MVALAELALAEGDPEGARSLAERAVAVLEPAEISPERVALVRFVLARALWSDPKQRARAVELATKAAEGYREHGPASEGRRVEVETWLRSISSAER